MQIEVTTKIKPSTNEVILDVKLLPRGSGNRAAARRLAKQFRTHERLSPHVSKVVCGTSRVTVHLINSLELISIISELKAAELAKRADKSQLKLFSGLRLA